MKKVTLMALLCACFLHVRAAYTPVSLTGYNADVISNGSVAALSSISSFMTNGFDSAGYAFVAQDYNFASYTPSHYLPTGGLLTSSLTSGLTFQLADYSSNNALRLHGNGDTATLYFATPQNAGAVYLLGTSGSGISDFDATVNFTDGSSQTFSSLSYPDWYASGGSVVGIGRVSTSDNHTEGTTTAPSLFQLLLSIDPANYSRNISGITIHKTSATGFLAVMAVSAEDICSGAPTAGSVSATATSSCSEFTPTLTLPGTTASAGINYQWQSSSDGGVWSNVSGATDASYVPDVTDTVYYRAYITCTVSSLSDTSGSIELMTTTPAPTVATLPFYEGFESWIATCYSFDRPGLNWLNNPTSGNNSWRRDDEGSDASWTASGSGSYSPAYSVGAHSARFHSYFSSGGSVGNMDLVIDFSAAGTKNISFDYNNADGSDELDVMLSEDGGLTFTTLNSYFTTSGWEHETLTTTSTAANAILRLSATSDFGNTDIGLDNLSIILLETCSGTPTIGPISATATTGCSPYSSIVSVDTPVIATGIGYQWQTSSDGTAWSDIAGETNTSYAASGIAANTWYRAIVNCTASGMSDSSAPLELMYVTPVASTASLPFFESFESWIGSCFSADRPSAYWLTDPANGENSWRRDDQGSDASWTHITSGTYSPVSTDGSHSARFHSYWASDGAVGNMDLHIDLSAPGTKHITFDYYNASGSDNLAVQLSEDGGTTFTTLQTYGAPGAFWQPEAFNITSTAASAIVRFSATSDFGATDIGLDSLSIYVLPTCTGTPTAGTISATATTGCSPYSSTVSLTSPIILDGIGYQWQSSADGVAWSNVPGATDLTYTTTVSATTYVRAYVTCSYSGGSDTTNAVELMYVVPAATTASLPFFESFESWIGTCFTADRPGNSWLNGPASGNNSWRRNDQGSDASWGAAGFGTYAPVSTDGSYSARFHSYLASGGAIGNLDLHIDLSPAGAKSISFDYHNTDGSDVLSVQLSEDGGSTFTTLASFGAPGNFWVPESITTTSTSANAIIRFSATSDFGNSDIGLDSLAIFTLPGCSGAPTAGTISATATTGCSAYTSTISVDAPILLTGIGYQWQMDSAGSWVNISGATGTSYTTMVTAPATYRFYVLCTSSGFSDTSASILLDYTGPVPVYATVPFFEGFESWMAGCYSFDRPGANWLLNPSTGNDSWRRDDQGSDASWIAAGFGGYTPASVEGSHSARFHTYEASVGAVGNLDLYIDLSAAGTKQISFDYNNDNSDFGSDVLNVELSEDGGATFSTLGSFGEMPTGWSTQMVTTSSVASHAIIRFSAVSDFGNTDIGVDSLYISVPSVAVGCDSPVSVAVGGVSDTGATITWSSVTGGAGYQYVITTTSGTPAGPGTFTSDSVVSSTTLTPGTTYYVYVRTQCTSGDSSSWISTTFTTLPAPCNTVLGLTVSGITDNSAIISWTAVSGAGSYQYVVTTAPGTPAGPGTATGSTALSSTGLAGSTTYYVYVRTMCASSDSAAWVTTSFTTLPTPLPCDTVTGVTVSAIADHSATITWTSVSGAFGYEYLIDMSPTAPGTGGFFTLDTTYAATGLYCDTAYYVHVRTDCSTTDFSGWSTVPFTTLPCSVEVVNVADLPFGISAYPNPATDKVTIQVTGIMGANAKVEVTDVAGKILLQQPMTTAKADIYLGNIASGIYFIRYKDDENFRSIKINKQ